MRILGMLVFAVALLGCGKGGSGKCAIDSDCKSGRNCWCEASQRTADGSCGVVGKETLGACLSDAEAAKKQKP